MPLPWKFATACFLRRDKRTLLIDYTNYKHPIHEGFFSPPGGKIEEGEEPIQTTRREMREETGIIVRNLVYRGIIYFDNEKRTIKGRPFKYNFRVHIYDCYDFDDSNAFAKEGKFFWVEDEQVPSLRLHEGDKELWRWLSIYKEVEGTIVEEGERFSRGTILKAIPFS